MYYEFSVSTVCQFLRPIEVLRMSTLSRFHNKVVRDYIRNTLRTSNIQNVICPCCGDWLYENRPVSDVFYDVPLDDIYNEAMIRNNLISISMSFGLENGKVERRKLLCDGCENTVVEIPFRVDACDIYDVNHSPFFSEKFKNKGTRRYFVTLCNSMAGGWATIHIVFGTDKYWNEYRARIPPEWDVDELLGEGPLFDYGEYPLYSLEEDDEIGGEFY